MIDCEVFVFTRKAFKKAFKKIQFFSSLCKIFVYCVTREFLVNEESLSRLNRVVEVDLSKLTQITMCKLLKFIIVALKGTQKSTKGLTIALLAD